MADNGEKCCNGSIPTSSRRSELARIGPDVMRSTGNA